MLKNNFLGEFPQYHYRELPGGRSPYEQIHSATKLILREAKKNDISYEVIDESDIIILRKDKRTEYLRNRMPSTTTSIADKICLNKVSTRSFLRKANLTVAKGYPVLPNDTDAEIEKIWNALQKPIVFKPTHGTHGNSVVTGITKLDDCITYIREYFKNPIFSDQILLEEMFQGNECRIIATRDKVIAAMERIPAFVIADGRSTIEKLIEDENASPIRNIAQDIYPTIVIDPDLLSNLRDQDVNLNSIPSEGKKIKLRSVSNVSAGGFAMDRTDEIHESVKELAIQAVRAIPGLSWAGIDFMSKNLSIQQNDRSYNIIEIGAMPEFDMHEIPMSGTPRQVAKELLGLMFPEVLLS
jgi:cyanophycin synthetase